MAKRKISLKKKLLKFVELVKSKYPLVLAVLYGSYAKGNPEMFSDIDVALFFKNIEGKRLDLLTEMHRLAWEIDSLIEVNVFDIEDLFSANKLNFIGEILETGKLIYIDHKEISVKQIKQLLKKLGKKDLVRI